MYLQASTRSGNLNSTDLVNGLRLLLADQYTASDGRWTQDALLNFIDRGHKRIVRDVRFPDCRITFPTVPTSQLYPVPLMLVTDAVYVAGQLAVPTDVPTLEGRQINYYDQRGDGSTTAGPYSDAPLGTVGQNAPLWAVQEPLSYPVSGSWSTPAWPALTQGQFAPDAQPWDILSRPRYYWRGGYIGFVPTPANVVTVCIDGVRMPDTIDALDLTMPTPDNFQDAVIWAALALAKYADDGTRADAQRMTAEQNYEREKRKLLTWRFGDYQGEQRNGPKPQMLRRTGRILNKRGHCW